MRKIILLMAVMSAALSTTAQTGSLVREDRVWNYRYIRYKMDGEIIKTEDYPGYHFEGTQEKDGKVYEVFRNGDNEEVALMRQEGGKVYLYADANIPNMWNVEDLNMEHLLYDLEAKPGDVYDIYPPEGMQTVEVNKTYDIKVREEYYSCQRIVYAGTLLCPFIIVDNIGPQLGFLHAPEIMQETGSESQHMEIESVTDKEENVLFTFDDFFSDPDGIESIITVQDGIRYSGGMVTAGESGSITICGLGGKVVAEGRSEVSTAGLQPGVYVARAGGKSLKIIVRD